MALSDFAILTSVGLRDCGRWVARERTKLASHFSSFSFLFEGRCFRFRFDWVCKEADAAGADDIDVVEVVMELMVAEDVLVLDHDRCCDKAEILEGAENDVESRRSRSRSNIFRDIV